MSMETNCEYCGKQLNSDDTFDLNVCQECLDDELNQPLTDEKIVKLRHLREEDGRERKGTWIFEDDDDLSKEDDDFSLFQDDSSVDDECIEAFDDEDLDYNFNDDDEVLWNPTPLYDDDNDQDLSLDFDHDYESEE